MRLTSRKRKILRYFEPDYQEWVTSEIGAPPFDVSGLAFLIYGVDSHNKRHFLESTRRTLEMVVKDGAFKSYQGKRNAGYSPR